MSPIPDFIVEMRELIGHHPLWLPGVTAVITRGDGHVLLVKRADNGAWTPVTGIVDPGEEPAIAAAREAPEETGVVITVDRLATTTVLPELTYDNGDRAAYLDLTFACTWVSGEAYVADDESTDVRWWPIDDLPPMSPHMASRMEAGLSDEREARFIGKFVPEQGPVPLRPDVPVFGVTSCAAGWVGVLLGPEGRPTVHVAASIADPVELVRESSDPELVQVHEGKPLSRDDLLAQGLTAPARFAGAGFTEDELLDACAAVCAAAALRHTH
ncbi:NUDIX hydrolase [Nocardioides sp. B-3]|uniref:NUDIX hydrolase n=1 Tax=Nocardioides sp. B-3 TaxID=2895565 RepID=UPI0021528141|nr:NUDIX domain-containing protein [Nocardioides sp. B-3]UUZ60092.1 NUDIX domain-containing protein [Nocardioides sp. B-3]